METTALIALLVFIVPMCFTPGPNNMLCAAHGAQHGFRSTVPLTLGMLTGWVVLGTIVGVAIVMGESLNPLKLAGCAIGIGGVFLYSVIDQLLAKK